VTALAVAPLLALAACAGAQAGTDAAAPEDDAAKAEAVGLQISTSPEQDRVRSTESPDAIALLPAAIAERGVLKVATSASGSAPLTFLADDEKTPIGNETDIAQLVADALGLELRLEVRAWADWPLALQSQDVDAVISNVTVTEERKELYDFSSYRNDQLGWIVGAEGDVEAITEPADIAGLKVAVGSGTNQEKILLAWNEENIANGLDPIKDGEPDYFDNLADALLALQSGRLDAYVGPNASLAFTAASSPQDFRIAGTLNGGWPLTAQIAVATLKGVDLAPAVTAALAHVFDDGTYLEVLERWGLEGEAIDTPETNPPGLPKTS